MINRFGTSVQRGDFVSYHTSRGDARTGRVVKFSRISGYGWRVETAPAGSCGVDDVIKSTRPGLPARADVTEIIGHRPPTPYECKFGEGATHYKAFSAELWFKPEGRFLKKWIVCPLDGLRYYR